MEEEKESGKRRWRKRRRRRNNKVKLSIIYSNIPYIGIIKASFRGTGGLFPLGELLPPRLLYIIYTIAPPTFWKNSVYPPSHIFCICDRI